MSTLDVIAEVLCEVAPRALKAKEIAALAGARLSTTSKTPETVVSRDLAMDLLKHGAKSRFLRVGRGDFILKEALPTALYNDVDEYANSWTKNLVAAGEIAPGVVDSRSIRDIKPADVSSFRQFHAFSGIGIWSRALREAGWPDDFTAWSGSCPCFPAGTLVLTQRGNIPIEDVQVGDNVLTHRARWRRVRNIGSEIGACVQLKGQGHWGLVCTPEHPFLSGDEEWTAASQMQGKRWSTVAQVPAFMAIPPLETNRGAYYDKHSKGFRARGERAGKSVYLGLYRTKAEAQAARDIAVSDGRIDVRGADAVDTTSLDFARFLGYWIGDGWTSGDSVLICGAKGDEAFLRNLMESAKLSCRLSQERTSSRAKCGSKTLVAWLRHHFGQGAAHKRIPAWLHGASSAYRQAFLSGYFSADGHRETNRKSGSPIFVFSTVSRALAVGTRILLNQAGISASIGRTHARGGKTSIEGRIVNERPLFQVSAYDKARSFQFNGPHGRGLVRTVTNAGESCRVYNLAVEEDESYCADGIVVHNCTPFSSAGRKRGFNDEQHLWPEWFRLIEACRPSIVFGEQVSSKDGIVWLDSVFNDLERADYSCRAFDIPACCFGAPHRRQRFYFVAYSREGGRKILSAPWLHDRRKRGNDTARRGAVDEGSSSVVSDAERVVRDTGRKRGAHGRASIESDRHSEADGAVGMGDTRVTRSGWDTRKVSGAKADRKGKRSEARRGVDEPVTSSADGFAKNEKMVRGAVTSSRNFQPGDRIRIEGDPTWGGAVRGSWAEDVEWIFCRPEPGHENGRWRPVKSQLEPLANVDTSDLGGTRAKRLKAFGNAIVKDQAVAFIEAVIDCFAEAAEAAQQ